MEEVEGRCKMLSYVLKCRYGMRVMWVCGGGRVQGISISKLSAKVW